MGDSVPLEPVALHQDALCAGAPDRDGHAPPLSRLTAAARASDVFRVPSPPPRRTRCRKHATLLSPAALPLSSHTFAVFRMAPLTTEERRFHRQIPFQVGAH